MTECLDVMDLLEGKKQITRQTSPKITRTNSQKSLQSQKSQSSQKSDYVDIAYVRQSRRSSSHSSSSSLEQSFNTMESRLRKYSQKADLIDQKYMISGYLVACKEYKELILTFKSYIEKLKGILQSEEQVDQYFQKYGSILEKKVDDYYNIKELFHKFMRMKIAEPYNQRVRNRLNKMENKNQVFDFFRIYLDAFKFIKGQGFEILKRQLTPLFELREAPQDFIFDRMVEDMLIRMNKTRESREGDALYRIFVSQVNQVKRWSKIMFEILVLRYNFNIKYNLNDSIEKIMKSKRIYERIVTAQQQIDEFVQNNNSMSDLYLNEMHQLQYELDLMREQAVKWNIQLKDQKYMKYMPLIKFTLILKKAVRKLNELIEDLDENEVLAIDIIIKVQMQQQSMKFEDFKMEDDYIIKQYNKSVILWNYFENLRREIEK